MSYFRFLYKYSLLLSFFIVNTTWFTYHFATSYIDACRSWWNILLGQFHWSPPSSSHLYPVHIPLSHYENYAQKLQSINWEEEKKTWRSMDLPFLSYNWTSKMEELGQCSTVSDQFTAQFGTLFPTLTRTATGGGGGQKEQTLIFYLTTVNKLLGWVWFGI
jgi:hypothetical protein